MRSRTITSALATKKARIITKDRAQQRREKKLRPMFDQEEIYRAGQEPAFPTESAAQTGAKTWRYEGMTLRDYFAAKALPRVIATCANDDRHGMSHADYFAGRAYELADAMLKARQS